MVRILKFIAGTVVAAVITLALAEFALRILFDEYDPDQDLVFVTQPGGYRLGQPGLISRHWKNTGDFDVSVRINDAGFRDSKDLTDSTSRDWFVVGDSFAFGFGVEEESRFSNRLEESSGVPVYNISISNNLEGYLGLVEHARRQGADIGRLIISVCMENDVYPYPEEHTYPIDEPRALIAVSWWNIHYLKHLLANNSSLYKAVTKLVHRVPALRSTAVDLGLIRKNLEGIPAWEFSDALVDSSAERTESLARLQGIEDVLVVIIPSRGLWVNGFRDEHRKIHDGFVHALETRGLDVVDLRAEFEKNAEPFSYHFENDGHWNESGHALAARVIAKEIASRRSPR